MRHKKHIFNNVIIKQYDIRGEYGNTLTEEDAYFLGNSLGTYLRINNINSKICVGYDGRKSSPQLKKCLIDGFLDVGFDIIELGLIPTPVLYYACHTIASTGVMVTASHNPKEDNGFKIVVEKKSFFGESLKKLSDIAANGEIKFSHTRGIVKSLNINKEYIEKITALDNHFARINTTNLKIVWDASNGAASGILKDIVKKLPGEHIVINDEVDGNFPSHPPDPTKEENLQQLKDVIRNEKCDFGIAFDGDVDRLVLVNNECRVFYGDQLLCFFANDLLKRHHNAKIIADIKTSKTVLDEIKKLGGKPIIWKTGYSHIKAKMLEENAILGGEVSGHLFFKENYYGYDDALFAACKLVFLFLDKEHRNYFTNLPITFVSPEIRIFCEEDQKHAIVCKIKKILDDKQIKYIELDGVRVENENGWWLIRPSNTESNLVVRLEGYSQDNFHFILNDLSNILRVVGIEKIPDEFLI